MGPNPNGPLSKLLESLDTQGLGVRSVGPTVGDFLDAAFLPSTWLVKLARDLTRPISPKWWFSKGNPRLFQGNLGWSNIIIF